MGECARKSAAGPVGCLLVILFAGKPVNSHLLVTQVIKMCVLFFKRPLYYNKLAIRKPHKGIPIWPEKMARKRRRKILWH